MAKRPGCFDSDEQWFGWRKAARLSCHPINQFCADCTPAHQAEMCKSGRCEYPETVFFRDKDGWVRGLSPDEKGWFGSVTGHFEGTGKRARKEVVAVGSPEAVMEEIRRRKAA